ncbi:MAG: ATP-binding cassette domain-containing protein [Gemmatimonadota bacterium]|nr:ATP-binding cassette domain-containing protein [Gemmatimonadota bacterium]
MPEIRVENLGIRRGGRWILRGFEWRHPAGRIAWLTGENGAGKSSILRILAGRARPTMGRVVLEAGNAPDPRALYYHPGMRLPPEVRASDWDRLVDAVTAGATPHEELRPSFADPDTRIGDLSTGEAKRLQLEAILRGEAPFVFLDEPYSHLSESGQRALTAILRRRASGAVVVVATNQAIPADVDGVRISIERP